jgi:exosortase F-associated protein
MLNKYQDRIWNITIITLLIVLLALVRGFENQLFYDPFLEYFKKDFNSLALPFYDVTQLFLGLLFRYTINMVLSLAILYVIFKEIEMIQFTSILYGFFFLVLMIAFFMVLTYGGECKEALFYIRRFLIQPIFLILFIPAFYYQKKGDKK